jgi:GrpB-like predicted nucleotidyltransferase (UPF0157 family)
MPYMRNIVVVPYDSQWPRRFEREAQALRKTLSGVLLDVRHVGSTAVPGLSAKPVIDILVVVRDLVALDERNPAMEALGYEPEGALFVPESRFFSKGEPDARTSHLHAYALGHPEIDRHLDLCAYLAAHPTEAERYAALKAELAKDFRDDLLAYSRGKTPLLAELIERAGRWRRASGC